MRCPRRTEDNIGACSRDSHRSRAYIVFGTARATHSTRAVRILCPASSFPFPTARHANYRRTGNVSDALQNLMLQHASIDTFIKHYLPRRVTADTRAIVSGYEPQYDLMRVAYQMTR